MKFGNLDDISSFSFQEKRKLARKEDTFYKLSRLLCEDLFYSDNSNDTINSSAQRFRAAFIAENNFSVYSVMYSLNSKPFHKRLRFTALYYTNNGL